MGHPGGRPQHPPRPLYGGRILRGQADNLRTYPVYPPDKEPAGYWEWLQKQKPAPLVDPATIHSNQDWIAAGELAFRSLDKVSARTRDPELLRLARNPATFKNLDTLPNGSVLDVHWVVTDRGVQLTIAECSACHRHIREDKSVWLAGPPDGPGERIYKRPGALIGPLRQIARLRDMAGTPPGEFIWRISTTPWAPDERVERIRTIADFSPELGAIVTGTAAVRSCAQTAAPSTARRYRTFTRPVTADISMPPALTDFAGRRTSDATRR